MIAAARRVGLLGGTFDPVHLAHLVVAEHLLVGRGLDEVRLLVAGDPWMKDRDITPATVRVELAKLAVEGLDGIEVDDRETRRTGPTFTADTLAELHHEEPGTTFEFCLGTDAANNLHRWERHDDVLALATVVVVARPGSDLHPDAAVAGRLVHLSVPALEISSTELRRRYRQGEATRFLVPPSVHRRIGDLGLYGAEHG